VQQAGQGYRLTLGEGQAALTIPEKGVIHHLQQRETHLRIIVARNNISMSWVVEETLS